MSKYFVRNPVTRTGFLLLSASVVVACSEGRTTDPLADPQVANLVGATLLSCPTGESRAASGSALPLVGGVVAVEENLVAIPANAVVAPTRIELEVPAGEHMRVDLRANGAEHFQFLAPLIVTIDYSRCPAEQVDGRSLSVWHVDGATGELLENMGGIDNRALRQITFTTDHFSGYAIAN